MWGLLVPNINVMKCVFTRTEGEDKIRPNYKLRSDEIIEIDYSELAGVGSMFWITMNKFSVEIFN